MPGGSERPGMPEAEGMTMHVTEYADGEEMYSYDYAMLGQKYCIDRIGGIHHDHYDYDICRIVFNPDLYELPVLWYGAPVSDGFIETTEQYRNTAFLWDSDYLSQTGDMEFEGETYHFEELCGTALKRILFKDGDPVMVIYTDDDGNPAASANGHVYVYRITGIDDRADESLFEVEPGLEMITYGH